MGIRGRIAWSMLSVVALAGGISGLIGGYLLQRNLGEEARNRVRQDLNAAQEFYHQRMKSMEAALRYTAIGERFSQAVLDGDIAYLAPRLAAVRRFEGFDLLCVTDASGRVTHRAQRPERSGDSLSGDTLVRRVLSEQAILSDTRLIPMAELEQEDPSLVERARMRVLSTSHAKPSTETELTHGMMLCAAAPVRGKDGRLAGVMRAGILLNRDLDLVDQVQNTVFHGEQYRRRLLGTATVFQQDVRISTNVLQEDGSRAVGSRVSAEVHECVLERGQTWVGRTWVVNDWYVSATAPIVNADGQVVGMLDVGVLDQKFQDMMWHTLAIFGLVTAAGLLAATLVSYRLARGISRPISQLASAASRVAEGDFSRRISAESTDEIGCLTESFNTMAASLKVRDELLKEQTRQQLTRSERLAAIGRLAAGVAHEINNPLTGVLTFAHMLLRNAQDHSQGKQDLENIIQATIRCRDIIRGLLDFSRQNVPHKEPSNLNDVVRRAMNLTRNQARIHGVDVVEKLDDSLPPLIIDPNQMQEVFVNIMVNAIDAMPEGGMLTVRTQWVREGDGKWVECAISDTGCGIPPENIERIFDPFFTTKQTDKGTGLGLAVSYGIVSEHNGHISVSSEPGQGTTVTVRLSESRRDPSDERKGTNSGGG